MRKLFYIIGFITSFTLSTGIMFEFLHWPYAGKIMVAAFLLLNFGLIPSYFMAKYKQKI